MAHQVGEVLPYVPHDVVIRDLGEYHDGMNFLPDDDNCLLGCDTVQCGRCSTKFQRNVHPALSKLKMEAVCFSETSATLCSITWHHVAEDGNVV
jgi:hypothetical protein